MSNILRAIRIPALAALAVAATLVVGGHARTATAPDLSAPAATPPLSLLTYNVHGLPWPLASGRDAAFAGIAGRLRALRALGAQPHIVVLQEAFTAPAKRIGAEAGYRYLALGPSAADRSSAAVDASDRRFERGESWLKGEGLGKFADSGLVLLSDYPVLRVRRVAYPDYACAGFDCLANKGVLLVALRLPDGSTVQVATTHLVSRFATDVADDRNFYAYRRELDTLAAFLRAAADPGVPLILAGDFNVGVAPGRLETLEQALTAAWKGLGYAPPVDAMRRCVATRPACSGTASRDASLSLTLARDWQLVGAAAADPVRVKGIRVLFGRAPDGTMLSDHVGYEADYAFAGPRRTG
jgi:endonuclease/exonuclease/phosphatase family metal-dependent hydrolase